jgi:hypothetical protein
VNKPKKATLINVLTPAFRDKLINEKKVPKEKVIFIILNLPLLNVL